MRLDDEVRKKIEEILSNALNSNLKITNLSSISGGSINSTYKAETNEGFFFIKINKVSEHPGMFEAETKGLNLLKAKSKFKIPEVFACDSHQNTSFLILEYLSPGLKTDTFFEFFGKTLADMHRQTQLCFGLDHDNFIGSLQQSNKNHYKWTDFLIEERLEKQLKIAVDTGKMPAGMLKYFQRLYNRLDELLPVEMPSLIHGDLWGGNYLPVENGVSGIFDPAVYYGHREMDIAMTKLFGGFDPQFYMSYNDIFPLESGWEERTDIYNLYPLIVHVNLFGGAYIKNVERIITRYT